MKTGAMIVGLVFCVFMGIMVISVGLGAAFPSINRIAKPVVCPNGNMIQESRIYNPFPGKTVSSQTWYCVEEGSGSKRRLSMFPISMFAGTIYGLLLYAALFVMRLIRSRPSA
ncbi:hypothetical protein [Leptospira kobayashii]|uniref:hypothetical protein n=1 Tax=Leptospira kobayashii TaxID=1917830 RepID=UPI000D593517|nr:hypothetical protein [Leptospira kobayashii]